MLRFFGKGLRTLHEVKREERGFTLIELLVVVIIIGILAAIAIPTFLAQRDQARKAMVESDVRNAAAAATTCSAANDGSYSSCDLAAIKLQGFNPSAKVAWSGATITPAANSWTVTGVKHADNATIIGSFSTTGANAGQVQVAGPS